MSTVNPTPSVCMTGELRDWFRRRAAAVDRTELAAHEALVYLAEQRLLAQGVDAELGGDGGDLSEMVQTIATVATECMTSAFVLWSHRALIELVTASDNRFLHSRVLPALLNGKEFGATGLADAVRRAAGIGALRLRAEATASDHIVSGFVPWATNLVPGRFVIAVAAQTDDGEFLVAIVPADTLGMEHEPAPHLLALDGSASGSLQFDDVRLSSEWVLSKDGARFLAEVRPRFLLLQCGLPWGIAAAALERVSEKLHNLSREENEGARKDNTAGADNTPGIDPVAGERANIDVHAELAPLLPRLEHMQDNMHRLIADIAELCRQTAFDITDAYNIMKTRKELTELAIDAVWLELQTAGGRGYAAAGDTARRLREAAFLPLQTPTLAQLQLQMDALEDELRANSAERG